MGKKPVKTPLQQTAALRRITHRQIPWVSKEVLKPLKKETRELAIQRISKSKLDKKSNDFLMEMVRDPLMSAFEINTWVQEWKRLQSSSNDGRVTPLQFLGHSTLRQIWDPAFGKLHKKGPRELSELRKKAFLQATQEQKQQALEDLKQFSFKRSLSKVLKEIPVDEQARNDAISFLKSGNWDLTVFDLHRLGHYVAAISAMKHVLKK